MKKMRHLSYSILFATITLVRAQDSSAIPNDTSGPANTLARPAPASATGAAAQSTSTASNSPLAAGVLAEQSGNLVASAAAYREAIQEFDRQRPDAANAIFRLGEVYRKLGRQEEAKVQYARILREFPEMAQLTELSHAYLLGNEPKPTFGYATGGGFGGTGAGMGGGTSGASAGLSSSSAPNAGIPEAMLKRYGLDIAQSTSRSSGIAAPIPAPESAQARAERINCVNNLKQLALAARVFATDHQDVHPRTVGEMKELIGHPKILHCPSDTQKNAADSWEAFSPETHMSYEYQGGTSPSKEPHVTLFKCPIHHNIALSDGSVQRRAPAPAQSAQPYMMDPVLARRYGLIPPGQPATMSDELRKRYGLDATNTFSSPTQTNLNKR